MNAISYTAARENLASTMDRVCADHTPVIITRNRDQAVVMLSLEDYECLAETSCAALPARNDCSKPSIRWRAAKELHAPSTSTREAHFFAAGLGGFHLLAADRPENGVADQSLAQGHHPQPALRPRQARTAQARLSRLLVPSHRLRTSTCVSRRGGCRPDCAAQVPLRHMSRYPELPLA